jgi:hypothetical protein
MAQTIIAAPQVFYAGEKVTIVGRFKFSSGEFYNTSNISGVSVYINDLSEANQLVLEDVNLPPSAVLSDTLVIDEEAEGILGDAEGRNFKYVTDSSAWTIPPTGGHVYRVEFLLGITSGGTSVAQVDLPAITTLNI